VFNNTPAGAAPLESVLRISDGVTTNFRINLRILESQSTIVYVDKVKKVLETDYIISWLDNSISFITAPPLGSIIEIITFGIGGIGILDVQEFIADGETNLFLTDANYIDTAAIYVTVDGEFQDVNFVNSSNILEVQERTLVQFGQSPERSSVIKIVVLSSTSDTNLTNYSVIRVNNQSVTYDGSTRSFDLINFVSLSRGSALSGLVIDVNGIVLRGVDTILEEYNGSNNSFILGIDPLEASGSILPVNIKVFINGELKQFVRDYDYDGVSKNLILNRENLQLGDTIKIEVDLRSQFNISNNTLVLVDSIDLIEGDTINVTWFSEYPTMDIVSDEFTGGKVNYRLKQAPLDIAYVWAYKNGEKLTADIDFYLSGRSLYLKEVSSSTDIIKIIQFGSKIYQSSKAFELYKDMLNIDYFKRYSIGEIRLQKDLTYYDKEILVDNPDKIYTPSTNKPGIITINAEKIVYYKKVGNTLSQLRRGVFGSSIPEIHLKDSNISDSSETETLPYSEEQQRFDFVGDGSSLLIGPLPFIPSKVNKSNWFKTDIPDEYGPCYELEIFVAGKRLRKDPVDIYDESLGSFSPLADKTVQAEFSVDGSTPFVRISEPVEAGLRIIIIRKQGRLWYDNKLLDISSAPLIENTNTIARFIAQRSTGLPE
jgi:hypothetical protein